MKINFILLFLFQPFLFFQSPSSFQVEASHPGLKENPQHLTINISEDNKYTTNVESVICFTNQCKIITVTLEWDQFGDFSALIIPKGQALEKYVDGKALDFDQEDYQKLNQIIRDPFSILDGLTYNDLQLDEEEGLDGYSGATKAFITEKDVVVGATLSCFTLWHWVNSREIKSAIRQQSLSHLQKEEIETLMNVDEERVISYLLEYFISNPKELEANWVYFLGKANDLYASEIKELLQISDEEQQLQLLSMTFKKQSRQLMIGHILENPSFQEQLLEELNYGDYQEVNMLTTHLSENHLINDAIITKLLPLLDAEDILISRNVYWYLSDFQLSKENEKRINKFQRKKKKYLQ
ncbi:hypothetical protein [Flammeovirga pacifica]|nr:hypothetical protein [Flammeovirga pacifica]